MDTPPPFPRSALGTMKTSLVRSLDGSLLLATCLIALDAVVFGSFLFSAAVVPIWFLVAVVKAFIRRKNWSLGILRIVIPLVTLALVGGNAWLQSKIARARAELIIDACIRYQKATGAYPPKLDALVPEYLHSIPRAKFSLWFGNFFYMDDGLMKKLHLPLKHSLMWFAVPPFDRPYYQFEEARWGYLD